MRRGRWGLLRALPDAFVYRYAGSAETASGKMEKFDFRPNPDFSPPSLETQILKSMAGEIWIDPAQERVTRLKGWLTRDVNFGWGLLGRLDKGGWIEIDQAEVSGGQWRTVRFQMEMSAKGVFPEPGFRHGRGGKRVQAAAGGDRLPAGDREDARERRSADRKPAIERPAFGWRQV